ncbi:MAG: YHS domain-containing protein [Candidatus Limnocylindrales bacterium]
MDLDFTPSAASGSAIDPVCGMTVDIADATAKGLHEQHDGVDHYFCGKGCLLEFRDDPAKYLDPGYVPSM